MRNLVSIYEECKDICRDLDIPIKENVTIKYNGRIRNKWGYCRDKKNGTFEISIAKVLGDDETPKKLLYLQFYTRCCTLVMDVSTTVSFGKNIARELRLLMVSR